MVVKKKINKKKIKNKKKSYSVEFEIIPRMYCNPTTILGMDQGKCPYQILTSYTYLVGL